MNRPTVISLALARTEGFTTRSWKPCFFLRAPNSRIFHTSPPLSARTPDPLKDWRKRHAAYKQGLRESVARDTAQFNKIRAHVKSGGSLNDEELQETFDELKRDYMHDLRRYPLITGLSAFASVAIFVVPVVLLSWWWEGALSVEKDEAGTNDKVDWALSNAMLEGIRDGGNERSR